MNDFVGQFLAKKDYKDIHVSRHLLPFEDHKFLKAADARVMVRGAGVYLWDEHGNKFLDGLSGLWCTALGYGRPELIAAAAAQMETLSYCSQYFNTTNPAIAELSAKLFDLLPSPFSRVLYTNSGSEANDLMIKLVRRFWQLAGKPGKRILIARHNGYHGATIASASLGGMKLMHELSGGMIDDVHHIGEPYRFGPGMHPTRPRSACTRHASWRQKYWNWARTGSVRLSPNHSRARAASFFRRPATGPRSNASAPDTMCCSAPTKWSAASAAPAAGSRTNTSASRRT